MKDSESARSGLQGSAHYQGVAGSKYFSWQDRKGEVTGRIEARKFSPYISLGDSVLDFGCGGGRVLKNIKCHRRIGVEINPVARSVAIQQGVECYESLEAVADNSVNVVISNHALEHVLFPIGILKGLINKLQANGLLLVCLPLDDWRTQSRYDSNDIHHHLHTWTPQLLGNSLCEAGFNPTQFSISILTHAWFPRASAVYGKIPELVFDVLCRMYAALSRQRQLFVVAQRS